METRILALDLDGTLLPRSKVLTSRARNAVRAAAERGISVVLATGKTWHLAARYADELGVFGPVLALDGALVKDWPDGTVRRRVGVPAGRLPGILDTVRHLDLLPFLSDEEDRLLVHSDLEPLANGFLDVYASRIEVLPDPVRAVAGDAFFLAMLGSPEEIGRGEDALRSSLKAGGNGLTVFRAEWFDRNLGLLVVRPEGDKGTALAALASDLGVAREEVVAVGDWRNDRGMVQWAGLGVVMADAHPELLAVADVVLPADSEADGAAAFLEDLLGDGAGPVSGSREPGSEGLTCRG